MLGEIYRSYQNSEDKLRKDKNFNQEEEPETTNDRRKYQAATYIYEGETGFDLENVPDFTEFWNKAQTDNSMESLFKFLLTEKDEDNRQNFLTDINDQLFLFFLEKNFKECFQYLGNLMVIRAAFLGNMNAEEKKKVILATLDFVSRPARREYNNFVESRKDKLTGLWNRKSFESYFNYVKRSQLEGKSEFSGYVFIMFDIDNFKEVNDRYGHRSGDKTLRKLGEVLLGKDMFRSEDLCFRYGGDEFGVFVPIKTNSQKIDDLDDPEEANLVMRRIEEIMARVKSNLEQTAMSGGDKKDITFSAGITFGSADDLAHITTLKKTADQALYAAKEGGRSSYAIQRELQVAHKDDQASADTENKPIVLVRRVDELTTNEELKQLF